MRKRRRKRFTYGKEKRDYTNHTIIVLAILIVVQSAVMFSLFPTEPALSSTGQIIPAAQQEIPIHVNGFEPATVTVSPSVLYMTSNCKRITMVTTEFQTYSINNGLENIVDFRPTVHDVFRDTAEGLGASVRMVKIESIVDSTYYAKLYVQQNGKLLELDAKPSDSVALAVRFNAPVYVSEAILQEHGENIC